MFFIHKKASSTKSNNYRLLLLPLVTFCVLSILTFILWMYARNAIEKQLTLQFKSDTTSLHDAIEKRLSVYSTVLYGIKGLFVASNEVARNEFKEYQDTSNINSKFPGISGISFIRYVPAKDKVAFISSVQKDTSLVKTGYPFFTIKPPGERSEYYVGDYTITATSSATARTSPTFGLDYLSIPTRAEGIRKAVDSNSLVATNVISLLGSQAGAKGFSLYLPVYKNTLPSKTLAERRNAVLGVISATFNANLLFNTILGEQQISHISMRIYDTQNTTTLTPANLLFSSDAMQTTSPRFMATDKYSFGSQQWTIQFLADKDFVLSQGQEIFPGSVLVVGILFALLISILLYFFEFKRMNNALDEEKNKLQTLIEALPIGVSLSEYPSGKIQMINSMGKQMLGRDIVSGASKEDYTKAYAIEKRDGTPYPYNEMTAVIAMETGKIAEKDDMFVHRPDDSKIQMKGVSVPIRDRNGNIKIILNMLQNITKEKEVDRMKTEFISLASHQLRTPLSAMKWFLEMLLDQEGGPMNEKQMQMVRDVNEANERMIDLVNGLLNVSRMESGRIVVEPEPTDMQELLDGIKKEVVVKLHEKKQTIIITIDPNLPKISLDKKLIRQVYLNLLTNAIKYSPDNTEVTVTISQKDSNLLSQITDQGYGIPTKDKEKVFQKFYRGDNIVKLVTEGNGLGMYLVKAIVDSSGGKIWFESHAMEEKTDEKPGTTFWFTLPLSGMIAKKGEVIIDS